MVTREQLANYCAKHEKLRDYVPENAMVNREFLFKLFAVLEPANLEKLSELSAARAQKSKIQRMDARGEG
jgi:hypothetical protein